MTGAGDDMRPMRLRIAGVPVEVSPRHAALARACVPFVDGRPSAEPLLSVRASDADLDFERGIAPGYSDAALELCAAHRRVADALATLDRVVLHSCVVEYGGRAYAFAAPSGTGKSTHAGLWLRYLGWTGARVLNGDKPFVHAPAGGGVTAFGSPWTGKEGWGYNGQAPLAGICVLRQAPACAIGRLGAADAVGPVVRQCHVPRGDPAAALAVLGCVDRILARVPVWSMGCDVSERAVRTSFEAMTGEAYPGRARGE